VGSINHAPTMYPKGTMQKRTNAATAVPTTIVRADRHPHMLYC